MSGKIFAGYPKKQVKNGSTTKRAITGQIYSVYITHAKPSLCPFGRLSPVNGRELNKTGHPAINLSTV